MSDTVQIPEMDSFIAKHTRQTRVFAAAFGAAASSLVKSRKQPTRTNQPFTSLIVLGLSANVKSNKCKKERNEIGLLLEPFPAHDDHDMRQRNDDCSVLFSLPLYSLAVRSVIEIRLVS